ncbi:MAG: hypothetical protein ACXVZT_00570 [Terriglobales bacterium]
MRLKPWAKMPTRWIQDRQLRNFQWKVDGSAGTAALMIYFALCQFATERPLRPGEHPEPKVLPPIPLPVEDEILIEDGPPALAGAPASAAPATPEAMAPPWAGRLVTAPSQTTPAPLAPYVQILIPSPPPSVGTVEQTVTPEEEVPDSLVARLTYDDLASLTGLSRARISAGLEKLIEQNIIWRVDGSGSYGLAGFGEGKRWAKLPGRVLQSAGGTSFTPFSHFFLRSRHELNALKLHLYYANIRGNGSAYSEVAYGKISEKTGVPERDIAKANTLLVTCGILVRTRGLPSEDPAEHEANKYYLAGYEGFFITKKAA